MTYSIFATSIITKPLGSYIFGSLAMSLGAGVSLVYSLFGVAFFTVLIGLIPIYESAGAMAPLLLIIVRGIRGVFTAGESAIAKFYILEDKPDRLAFRSSYMYQTSSMLGLVLASLVSTLIITYNMQHLWRYCFIFGGVVGVAALILRKYRADLNAVSTKKKLFKFASKPLVSIWQKRRVIMRVSVVYAFSHITYSTPFILLNSLVPMISDLTLAQMMKINTSLLVFDLISLPAIGIVVERFSPSKVMSFAATILAVSIIPLWYLLEGASFWYVFAFRAWIVFFGVMFACPFNLWCAKQISSDDKYIIYGAASTFGAGLFGKVNPAICLYLFHASGSYMIISFYLAAFMGITAFTVFKTRLKERSEKF
jgi:MFS family permease